MSETSRQQPEEVEGRVTEPAWMEWLYLAYLLMYPLPWLFERPSSADVAVSVVGIAVFLWLYRTGYRARGRRLLAIVAAILALGFALQPAGGLWGVFVIYAAAMVGNLDPPRHAAIAIGTIAAIVLLSGLVMGWSLWMWMPILFFTILVGASTLYTAEVERKNVALSASREQVRRLAVVAERERIARDLHDLLGHTLTVVAVKADLAGRLVEREPARARAEIDDIRRTARSALADVRAAVTGMRSADLAAELAAARGALEGAGIEVEDGIRCAPLPPATEAALAFVLREAVTNVVRHAAARRCRIAITTADDVARLEVEDDGRGLSGAEGNGLAGIRERLTALGGSLALASEGGTLLRATVPLTREAAP